VNRSLVKNALAACRKTWDRETWEDGGVEFVAIFPKGSLSCEKGLACSCGGQDLSFELPDGSKPFGWGRWWKPDDWSEPLGSGVATVAIDRDEGPQVYTVPIGVEPCEGHLFGECGQTFHQTIPNLCNLLDKPYRARWGEGATWTDDPTAWAAATREFEILKAKLGFLPVMDEWLWESNLYGGKWYLPLRWEPRERWDARGTYFSHPLDCASGLWDVVSFMDGLRKEWGADIRVYGDEYRERRDSGRRNIASGQPGDKGEDYVFFLEGIEEWKNGAEPRDWKVYS
jgi:hypothetical protein